MNGSTIRTERINQKEEIRVRGELAPLAKTVNRLFIHEPKLYYEFPEMKRFLLRCWRGLDKINMALNNLVTETTLMHPLKKADFAKCMAFMIFVYQTSSMEDRKTINTILKRVKEKAKHDYKTGLDKL